MAENFKNVDRDMRMLLPADLRQWVPEDDPLRDQRGGNDAVAGFASE